MLRNFYKTGYRSLLRNKVFSLLNILGLAIGMAVCFFILQYINFERSYEKYNSNADNIYRIPLEYDESSGNTYTKATNHPAVGPALKANFPEVLSFARLIPADIMLATSTISRTEAGVTTISNNEKRVFFSDHAVLKMFAVQLIHGNAKTALTQISTIAISASEAKKYFGNDNPIGEMLYLNGSFPVTVCGVFMDIPENAHLKFDMLISFPDEKFHADTWSWPEFYTYVMLAPGTNPKSLESKFPVLIERYLGSESKQHNFKNQLYLQPIKDIHLNSHYAKELEANGSERDTWLLSILGFFVLLIACINYINLSTAKVMERAGEVGLRKVVGASKFQLVLQFLTESIMVNCFSVILAAITVLCLAPFYESLIGKSAATEVYTSGLLSESSFWINLLLIITGGSFFIGIYPAVLMSKYNPVYVLKGKFYGSNNGIVVRKVLVAFQFILSIILIAGSLTFFNQLNFMRNQSVGYNKDHILVIKMPGLYDEKEFPKINLLQEELLKYASIKDVGLSSEVPGEPIGWKNNAGMYGETLMRNTNVSISQVDDHFFSTYEVQLIAGRNFKLQDRADIFPINEVFPTGVPIIANESFVKNAGFKTNEDAVNKLITFSVNGHEQKGEVIGIVKDYHQTSLKDAYQGTLYVFPSRAQWKYYSLNVAAGNVKKNISTIQDTYKKLFPNNPFEFFFLDDYFNQQYKSDQRFGKVFNAFTALAIFVSFLGLSGLLSFIIRLRRSEIGIRRILGAPAYSIIVIFFRDFFKLIFIATLITLPVIYFVGSKWLNNFAFHAPLSLSVFILPPLFLTVITLATVAAKSLKAVLSNPATYIRDE